MIGYAARTFILTTAFVSSAVAAAAGANQGTPFDGRWSGRGIPDSGVCTQSLRIEGQIINGIIVGDKFSISGRVAPSGAISFTGVFGPYHGAASGRLSKNFGIGSWRIQGPNMNCSGTWSAQRT
jgi:hypothetical protein